MPKAVITNRIYLDNPESDILKKIRKELTYKFIGAPRGKDVKFAPVETIKNYKTLPGGIISIPQARIDLIPDNYEIIDKRIVNTVSYPKPVHSLFPEQQPIFDEVNDNAIINALVGWGKSYTALWIAYKLKQKTLVITHSTSLRDQWIDDVEELFKITPGKIGTGTFIHANKPIVISNIQTLVKHVDKINKEFGFVIMDEMHHCPASTFSKILDLMHARYRLGLSGTLIRKDGKQVLFKDYFGGHVLKPPQSNTMTPTIKLVRANIGLDHESSWAERVTKLVNDENYQQFITALAIGYMDKGHSVLVIADRVEFLRIIAENCGDRMALLTGEYGDRDLIKQQIHSGEKKGVCGARQIFSEGLSLVRLSCVILATPISKNESLLEQIIGRIMRKYKDGDKLNPLVVDIQFTGYADRAANEARLGFYIKKGWEVETV